MPRLVAYNSYAKKGWRPVGSLSVDEISLFVEEVLKGKLETLEIPKLEYVERQCYKAEDREESSEDEEILKEILRSVEKIKSITQNNRVGRQNNIKNPKNELKDDL